MRFIFTNKTANNNKLKWKLIFYTSTCDSKNNDIRLPSDQLRVYFMSYKNKVSLTEHVYFQRSPSYITELAICSNFFS